MKVAIINKSDSLGGAAAVSRRLLHALRDNGVEATMLVADKRHDSPWVQLAGPAASIRRSFMAERLKVFMANGMNRRDLFKVDFASDGLPLHRNRIVKEADIICLGWVNQGLLSLSELRKILRMGKPVVWTMHDLWNFTGICHLPGACNRWHTRCGLCPLLGKGARTDDASFKTWNNKRTVYATGKGIRFVAVSNWLAGMARESSLLKESDITVIPNPFPIPDDAESLRTDLQKRPGGKFRIAIGAARLDDPVKGLPVLVEATRVLRREHPEEADRMELVTFGALRDPHALTDVAISHRHLGPLSGEEHIRQVYLEADAVVSTSLYETFGYTLLEGQVYGCIPVSFSRGGQQDIIDHLRTGYLADWSDNPHDAAANIADGLLWAMQQLPAEIRPRMLESARSRFSSQKVAREYISLFNELTKKK